MEHKKPGYAYPCIILTSSGFCVSLMPSNARQPLSFLYSGAGVLSIKLKLMAVRRVNF